MRKIFSIGIENEIRDFYLEGLCADEIREKLHLSVSTRSVERFISKLGITRAYREHCMNSIKRGRMSYDSQRVEVLRVRIRRINGRTVSIILEGGMTFSEQSDLIDKHTDKIMVLISEYEEGIVNKTVNNIKNRLIDLNWSLLNSKDDPNSAHKAEIITMIINKLQSDML